MGLIALVAISLQVRVICPELFVKCLDMNIYDQNLKIEEGNSNFKINCETLKFEKADTGVDIVKNWGEYKCQNYRLHSIDS